MTILADDDVIVDRNAEGFGGLDDRAGHVDVGPGRCRVATGMVVHHAIHYAKTLINKQIM